MAIGKLPENNKSPENKSLKKLSIVEVSKRYGEVAALDSTDLDMAEGEFLTLLGPSGSGKTTLLSIVAGLTSPTTGEVWIDGHCSTRLPPFKRGIGMVFQNYALFPHLTVFENIAFPLHMRRLPAVEVEREVRRVLDIIKLPQVADRFPRELSGGQQQRIALARCIVYSPSIVLMDEPLGALDKNLRDHMQMEIKRLHTEIGITVLYVTHDQEEALAMSDRICLMNNARIEQVGTPDDLYFRPKSIFAASFLGESNILDGVVQAMGEKAVISDQAGATFEARPDARFKAEERLCWMVRPESLRVTRDAGPPGNMLRGRLQDVVFAGGVTKIHVRTEQGGMLVAKQLTTANGVPNQGEEVFVSWSGEDTVLLPAATP
ncbi:ABC transporter ATP-binding protein [Bosea sp. LjRoot9]|uniref:ABC transporter ATP-binding protein n=1 Tax=Bosea sp. LjRoot9 TaxID=3342341 RepID=UPI003ECC697A